MKIAVLIEDMFEDVEYEKPAIAFEEEGHEITHIGTNKGKYVKGKKNNITVKIDETVDTVSIDDFDALFIPGGYSPDKLRVSESIVQFVSYYVNHGKPVFTICHGPQLLISADVLKGRKVTGWKSIIQDIKNAGAEYIDNEVVVDGNLVSSRSPKDISAFISESLKKLKK